MGISEWPSKVIPLLSTKRGCVKFLRKKPKERMEQIQHKHVEVGGLKLHVAETGTGKE